MKSLSLSKKLAIPAAALVVLGGAAGAVAATQGSSGGGRQAYLDDLAQRLNVSPTTLTADMRAALTDRINAAVAAGRITQAQANAIEARIAQGGAAPFLARGYGRLGLGLGLAVTRAAAVAWPS